MKKIAQYSSLAAAFIAGGKSADSQIAYHNINPDFVRTSANGFFVDDYPLMEVDMDADGSVDFTMDAFFSNGETFFYYDRIYATALNSEWSVLLTSPEGQPKGLKYGNPINDMGVWSTFQHLPLNGQVNTLTFVTYSGQCISTTQLFDHEGQFFDAAGKFMAVRKRSGSDHNYGWLRLSTDFHAVCPAPLNDGITLIVHDYAFNNSVNDPMFAGETGLDCNFPFPLPSISLSPTAQQVKWQQVSGAIKYKIKYRAIGAPSWITVLVDAPKSSKKLTGLSCDTEYEWKISSGCDDGGTFSQFSDIQTFATASCKIPEDQFETTDISVYPNPANNVLNIDGSKYDETFSIEIFDLQGQQLQFLQSAGNAFISLDISDLSNGLYIIMVSSESIHLVQKFNKL